MGPWVQTGQGHESTVCIYVACVQLVRCAESCANIDAAGIKSRVKTLSNCVLFSFVLAIVSPEHLAPGALCGRLNLSSVTDSAVSLLHLSITSQFLGSARGTWVKFGS